MDNNQNMQQMSLDGQTVVIPQAPQEMPAPQQVYDQSQQMSHQMYGQSQQMNQQMYGQSQQMSQQMYGQPQQMTQQQMYGQPQQMTQQQVYGQPQQMSQQMYGQPQQYGYNNAAYKQPKASGNIANNIKKAKNEFTGKVSKMGIGVYCLLGVVAAMLCIFGPFMNFASIHVKSKIDLSEVFGYDAYDYFEDYDDDDFSFGGSNKKKSSDNLKIKAADGFNIFELSKLSGSVDRTIKKIGGVTKSQIADTLEFGESYINRGLKEINDEYGTNIKKSSVKEVFGTARLLLKGRLALLLTPYIIIISGIGLFFFTIINKKIAKIVFAAIPLVCILWLMICSSHFFSIMGIGAWAIIIGSALGLVSAILDKPATI